MSQFISTHPAAIVAIVFAVIALGGAVFVAWPVARLRGRTPLQRTLLGGSLAMFVVGIGGGVYVLVGSPKLARDAVAGPESNGIKGLVIALAQRMHERPGDATGWTLLGRGYLTLGDPGQAAVAFRQASALAASDKKPELLSAYGEATTLAAGAVTPEAETAFRDALTGNPKDFAARYYLGRAHAERQDAMGAREIWQRLLADSPSDAPWRADLTRRLAALAPSDVRVRAMVESLAARLRARPNDPSGWQELLRSYVVLGEHGKARSALSNARAALRTRPEALATIEAEARSLDVKEP
jgi:cytochrome c-type biogenesis protein CcmH